VKVTRVYSDTSGQSHFEDLTIELQLHDQLGHLSDECDVDKLIFRENGPGYDYDWHCAPARQYVVMLDGQTEIEVSDGEKRTFVGGDILLLEDTTGRGHRTRTVGDQTRRTLFIVLGQ